MAFHPIAYIPKGRKDAIRQHPVTQITAIAHSKQQHREDGFTNHWCLRFQTGDRSSVLVDMSPSHMEASTVLRGGSKGYFSISEQDAPSPGEGVIKAVGVEPRAGLVVADVVDALLEAGRHRYEFDADGVGCRCWVTGSLTLFQSLGLGDSDGCEAAKTAITKLWPDGTDNILDQGAYYD
jgi:hypothetical protein